MTKKKQSEEDEDYHIQWRIDISKSGADNEAEAAIQALMMLRDPDTTALVFEVDGKMVDLCEGYDINRWRVWLMHKLVQSRQPSPAINAG